MRLYKITSPGHEESGVPARTSWAGSQVDARRSRMCLEEPLKHIPSQRRPRVVVIDVDVPTDKQGLLDFLNDERHE